MTILSAWLYGFLLGILAGPSIRFALKRMIKPIQCRLGKCPGRIVSSDYGIAFHCETCGKVSGFVSNRTIKETVGR